MDTSHNTPLADAIRALEDAMRNIMILDPTGRFLLFAAVEESSSTATKNTPIQRSEPTFEGAPNKATNHLMSQPPERQTPAPKVNQAKQSPSSSAVKYFPINPCPLTSDEEVTSDEEETPPAAKKQQTRSQTRKRKAKDAISF